MAETSERATPKSSFGIHGRSVLLLLVVLIPILLIQAFIYYEEFQARRAEELQSNLETAKAAGETFDAFVKDILSDEFAIGLAAKASPPLSSNDLEYLLDAGVKYNSAVRGFNWIDPDCSIPISNAPQAIGMDISDRSHFQEIASGREWIVGDLVLSKIDGRPVFTISRGIRDEGGRLLGVVTAAIPPDRLDSVLAVDRGKEAGISILDSKGMLVYRFPHSQVSWDERKWADRARPFREALEGKQATELVSQANSDTKSRFIAATPIRSIGWVAVAEKSEEDAMRAITSALIRRGGIFLSVVILSFLVAWAISDIIAGPMRMQKQLASLRGFGSEVSFAVSGSAEIQELTGAFNSTLGALRVSEERLCIAKEAAGLGIYDYDINSGSIQWDERVRDLWGVGPDTPITYELFISGVHPDDRAPTQVAVGRALDPKGSGQYRIEYRVISLKDGTERWVSATGQAFLENGRAVRLVGTVQDITERKRIEEALRKSEEHFRSYYELGLIGMAITSIEKDWVEYNDRICEILGYSREELGSLTWDKIIHPDDLAADTTEFHRLLAGEINSYSMDKRFIRKDGNVIHATVSVAGIRRPDGSLDHLVGILQDITKRKQAEEKLKESEERLRMALSAAQAGVWGWEAHSGAISWSPENYKLYGIDPAQGPPTRHDWEHCIHPADLAAITRAIRDTIKGRTSEYRSEFRVVHPKHGVRWLLGVGRVERGPDGAVTRMSGINIDITGRKHMEEETKKSRDELELRVRERTTELSLTNRALWEYAGKLERLNEELKEFAWIASHDLQEPLRKIMTFGDRLSHLKDSLGEQGWDDLDRMIKSVRRMASLVSSLASYAGMTREITALQPIELKAVVKEVVSDLELSLSEAGGHIEIGELPIIEADAAKMRQLFQNLISNAIKYVGKHKRPRVRVMGQVIDGVCRIEVEDNGIGFEERYVDRIFKPFQRLHGKSGRFEGTGMGLTICRKVVELHGGTITARSKPDEGSTFIVHLPVKQGAHQRHAI